MNNTAFTELDSRELQAVDGGWVHAAVYALGFVMGMSPLGACCVVAGCAAAGVAVALLSK